MQAFAIARHACHVHLGTQLGQAEGQQAAALPCFRSVQPAILPMSNSVPLPQVEVSYFTTPALPRCTSVFHWWLIHNLALYKT